MYDDVACPLIARKQLGDDVSNREIYATMRKILSMDGNVINRVDACFKLVSDLGESSPIGFIAKSSVTTSKFIEVASKWSNYNDLHMLSRIIGPNAYSHRIMAEIYQGRHKQIADALLTQEDVNAEWITVAKILISLDELSKSSPN